MQYIGGYIARKVDKELYSRQESETDSNSWIAARSNGNLVYPTDDLMDILLKCDEQFIVFHGNTLNTEKEWHASNILISMSTWCFEPFKIVPLKRSITVLFAFLIDFYINENNLDL